jgi:hypothetical protein
MAMILNAFITCVSFKSYIMPEDDCECQKHRDRTMTLLGRSCVKMKLVRDRRVSMVLHSSQPKREAEPYLIGILQMNLGL